MSKHDDPKTWVTPFAFDVSPNILYLPLASPLKRGLAMMIDGLLVAVLAESAGWLFILLVLATLLIQKQSKAVGKLFKWGLYLLMLAALISAVVGYYSDVTVKPPKQGSHLDANGSIVKPANGDDGLASLTEMVGYVPAVIVASQCEDFACAQKKMAEVEQALSRSSLPTAEQTQIINELVAGLPLSTMEKQQLYRQQDLEKGAPQVSELGANPDTEAGISSNTKNSTKLIAKSSAKSNTGSDEEADIKAKTALDSKPEIGADLSEAGDMQAQGFMSETAMEGSLEKIEEAAQALENQNVQLEFLPEKNESTTSPLAWIKGLLNDLGLGFGWAAFYFTVFTAWFDGQTLGKKLFGIRVIQLDGTKISLWDAFGRYGGYAAGFTTGLLGFFQIYWDANRQAIQDKISATVVIDVRKTKHEAALEHAAIDNKSINLAVETGVNI
ncbi:RDD family protein [Shewanella halifaxensis]|nr:RDD family protein [Shewanella halifaxensis]